jgi:glycosyltransferase 2 family protein
MKILFVLLKLTITLSLCYLLFSNVNVDALWINLARLGAWPIVAGVLLHFVVFLCGAFRWWMLLTHTHATTPFYKVFPSYYLGLFFNNLLPTGLGGDTARILHLRVRGISTKSLVSSTIMDRAIGISTVVMMGLCGVVISEELGVPSNSKMILVTLFVVGLLFIGILLSDRSVRFVEALARKYRRTRVRALLLDIILTCYSYRATKSRIALAYAISAAGQSLIILIYYMLGRGLGLNLSLTTYFVAIPVVFLAASLPVSIGGLGIREGTLVGMLIAAGANPQIAINLSLVYLLVLWISTMPGALVILFGRARKKNDPS